jgi:hypothetical protein
MTTTPTRQMIDNATLPCPGAPRKEHRFITSRPPPIRVGDCGPGMCPRNLAEEFGDYVQRELEHNSRCLMNNLCPVCEDVMADPYGIGTENLCMVCDLCVCSKCASQAGAYRSRYHYCPAGQEDYGV